MAQNKSKSKGQQESDETAEVAEEIAAEAEEQVGEKLEAPGIPDPSDLPTGERSHPPE